jgi:hypothetical protein
VLEHHAHGEERTALAVQRHDRDILDLTGQPQSFEEAQQVSSTLGMQKSISSAPL